LPVLCEVGLGSRNSVHPSVCHTNGALQIFWYHT